MDSVKVKTREEEVTGSVKWPVSGVQRTGNGSSVFKEIVLMRLRLGSCETCLNTLKNKTIMKAFRARMRLSIIHNFQVQMKTKERAWRHMQGTREQVQ